MIFGYDNLMHHLNVNWSLMHLHKWDMAYIDSLIPWHRQYFIDQLKEHIKMQEQIARDKLASKKKVNPFG